MRGGLGDGAGVPRPETRRSPALGRERTGRHALPGCPAPSGERGGARALNADEASHPHLPALRPSWGRGGHRGSRPGAGERERGRGRPRPPCHPAASRGQHLRNPGWPRGERTRWKSEDPADTCRKEWFSEHLPRGLSPGAAERQAGPCPAHLRKKAVTGDRIPSPSSAHQSSSRALMPVCPRGQDAGNLRRT